jgi:cyclopropane-fatty-acyl-phospholipid synthase
MGLMAEAAPVRHERNVAHAWAVVRELLRDYPRREFAVELWDGTRWEPEPGNFCRFAWHIRNAGALRGMLRSERQVALGEGFVYGDYDISGDILAVFPAAEYLAEKRFSAAQKLRLGPLLLRLPATDRSITLSGPLRGRLHSPLRDREAVGFHYDVSNDFYRLWLDRRMVYSCAYFESAEDTLDKAQEQKLDHICRKLRLRPGERLLDIGCGWGGLISHAAQNYGVQAIGITLSAQQSALAQQRIADAGLSSQCEVRLLDYRDAARLGVFDKLVSVGMIEHVGESELPEYFSIAYRLLKPGGIFLNHGIARAGNRSGTKARTFTDVYVFPDGELIPIASTLRIAEECGFELRDLENLREHYYLTLVQWLRRLESRKREAEKLVGEIKYRTWRLYLAGSAHYFRSGKLELQQALLWKRDVGLSGLPLTRKDWYRDTASGPETEKHD